MGAEVPAPAQRHRGHGTHCRYLMPKMCLRLSQELDMILDSPPNRAVAFAFTKDIPGIASQVVLLWQSALTGTHKADR